MVHCVVIKKNRAALTEFIYYNLQDTLSGKKWKVSNNEYSMHHLYK